MAALSTAIGRWVITRSPLYPLAVHVPAVVPHSHRCAPALSLPDHFLFRRHLISVLPPISLPRERPGYSSLHEPRPPAFSNLRNPPPLAITPTFARALLALVATLIWLTHCNSACDRHYHALSVFRGIMMPNVLVMSCNNIVSAFSMNAPPKMQQSWNEDLYLK